MANVWPAPDDLKARLTNLHHKSQQGACTEVVEWQGTAYRFASREFADREHFIDGIGAARNGGRFTRISGAPTLYLSREAQTALAELELWYAYYNLPPSAFQPRVLAGVAVSVGLVLDFNEPATLVALGLTLDHVMEEWRPLSAMAGRANAGPRPARVRSRL